ncbi:PREDICTED: gasdermin-A-like [Apaloderma vittatum]|uniref:gasdermin-A-like n=1 Tax=Apaloderma vittatum TaxID=57397 RepID=UPI000521BFD0|nr:PREDICTED: gasdermin-A-like [Apaloderma vittatum]
MFKKVTRSIAHQMDPGGELVPVHSILDHEDFKPLCLVRRKTKAMFRSGPSYRQTGYSLNDVLLPEEDDESTESLLSRGDQLVIQRSASDTADGSLSLQADPASVEMKAAASLAEAWSIKLENNQIPIPKLEALTKRKMNVNHSFIQQIMKTQQHLYVVHEAIETSEETRYEESTHAEGSFMAQIYAKLCVKGTQQIKQSITIPKGCTLAFRVIELAITEGSWGLVYSPHGKILRIVSDGFSPQKLRRLKEEVQNHCQILSQLSSDMFVTLLKAIKAVMRDRSLFQELTHQMEAVLGEVGSCELETESPDVKDLLSSLQRLPRSVLLQLARTITYALDALDELTEDQQLLLLESSEEKITSQQLQLVASILEHELGRISRCFSVDAGLLSFSREEQQKLTIAVVEMSGVKLQKDGSATCTEDAFSAVAALYVSLYILDLLSNSH